MFRIILFAFLFFSTNALSFAAESQQARDVVIVLDASGSMWGKINNQAKIDIAKDTINNILQDFDNNTNLGLIAYGHRSKSDCNDIETLIKTSPINKDAFSSVVKKINPKGMTPMTRSVQLAAEELKYTEHPATVILVSDGIETCNLNPCEISKELEQSGVDFTAHVIGFDIKDKKTEEQLKCIADNTGGNYLNAKDGASLKISLEAAVKQVKKQEHNLELVATYQEGGNPVTGVYWYVLDPESRKPVKYGGGTQPKYKLEPGSYIAQVKSLGGQASAEKEIAVSAEGITREEVVLAEEGKVHLIAVNKEGEEPLDDMHWEIYEIQPEDSIKQPKPVIWGKGSTPEYLLLPGNYVAHVKSLKGKASAQKEIVVSAGKLLNYEVVVGEEGIINLAAVHEKSGKALDNIYWEIYELVDPDSIEKPKLVVYGKGSTPEYKLLPGKYLAKAKSQKGQASIESEVEVIAGKRSKIDLIFPEEGEIRLSVLDQNGQAINKVYWELTTLVEADSIEKPVQIKYGGGSSPTYRVLPGKYLARATLPDKSVLQKEVEVIPGKVITETLKINLQDQPVVK